MLWTKAKADGTFFERKLPTFLHRYDLLDIPYYVLRAHSFL